MRACRTDRRAPGSPGIRSHEGWSDLHDHAFDRGGPAQVAGQYRQGTSGTRASGGALRALLACRSGGGGRRQAGVVSCRSQATTHTAHGDTGGRGLVHYLRRTRLVAIVSSMPTANVLLQTAVTIACVPTRVFLFHHSPTPTHNRWLDRIDG